MRGAPSFARGGVGEYLHISVDTSVVYQTNNPIRYGTATKPLISISISINCGDQSEPGEHTVSDGERARCASPHPPRLAGERGPLEMEKKCTHFASFRPHFSSDATPFKLLELSSGGLYFGRNFCSRIQESTSYITLRARLADGNSGMFSGSAVPYLKVRR